MSFVFKLLHGLKKTHIGQPQQTLKHRNYEQIMLFCLLTVYYICMGLAYLYV